MFRFSIKKFSLFYFSIDQLFFFNNYLVFTVYSLYFVTNGEVYNFLIIRLKHLLKYR